MRHPLLIRPNPTLRNRPRPCLLCGGSYFQWSPQNRFCFSGCRKHAAHPSTWPSVTSTHRNRVQPSAPSQALATPQAAAPCTSNRARPRSASASHQFMLNGALILHCWQVALELPLFGLNPNPPFRFPCSIARSRPQQAAGTPGSPAQPPKRSAQAEALKTAPGTSAGRRSMVNPPATACPPGHLRGKPHPAHALTGWADR